MLMMMMMMSVTFRKYGRKGVGMKKGEVREEKKKGE
jgi:hypothetical protein